MIVYSKKKFLLLTPKNNHFPKQKKLLCMSQKTPKPQIFEAKKISYNYQKKQFSKICEAVLFFSYLAFFLYSMGLFQLQGDFYIVCNHILNFWFFNFWYFSRAFFFEAFPCFFDNSWVMNLTFFYTWEKFW